jgi:hypothetical protein
MSLDEELLDAVEEGDIARVKKLLDRGANLNAKDILGYTPLHKAAMYGDIELVDLLLRYGADANAKTDKAETPLHLAASRGQADVVKMLLERGADVNARDEKGWTPLHFAAFNNHSNAAKMLLENGADANIRYNGRKTFKFVESYIESLKRLNLSVECSELRVGEWGRLIVKLRGSDTATLSLEGDVEWLDPGRVQISGESVVEVPVRSKASGELPVKVVVKSSGSESSKIVWLRVAEKVARCPSCGAPVEPGAKYCWNCGAKLVKRAH